MNFEVILSDVIIWIPSNRSDVITDCLLLFTKLRVCHYLRVHFDVYTFYTSFNATRKLNVNATEWVLSFPGNTCSY